LIFKLKNFNKMKKVHRLNVENKEVKNEVQKLHKEQGIVATFSNEGITKNILADLESGYKMFEALLQSSSDNTVSRPIQYSFADFVQERWGFAKSENGTADSFYHQLGIDPSQHTLASLYQAFPEGDTRKWLAPAIIREAIREGIISDPMYQELIRANIGVDNTSIQMPKILSSNSNIKKVSEGETIPIGTTKFGKKTVTLNKYAYGIEVSYEVLQFVPLNIIATYMEDTGNKFVRGLNTSAIQTLIAGDQSDGSESIGVIGVDSSGTLAYKDLLRGWLRMQLLGRRPSAMLANEAMSLEVLELAEFKNYIQGQPRVNLNIKTPLPQTQNHYLHSAAPANSIVLLDTLQTMMQLTAMDLMVESEKIVSKQLNGTYASMITGFTTLQRDARLVIDKSKAYSSFGLDALSWMATNDAVTL
jgi:Phage capsid family